MLRGPMPSQSAKILIFETARPMRRRPVQNAEILCFQPPAREVPAYHPVICVLLFLAITLGAWTAFFFLVGII